MIFNKSGFYHRYFLSNLKTITIDKIHKNTIYKFGSKINFVEDAALVKSTGVSPINNPFVVFNVKARADVLISIENIDVKIWNTDPTHAPNVMLINIIKDINRELSPETNIKWEIVDSIESIIIPLIYIFLADNLSDKYPNKIQNIAFKKNPIVVIFSTKSWL